MLAPTTKEKKIKSKLGIFKATVFFFGAYVEILLLKLLRKFPQTYLFYEIHAGHIYTCVCACVCACVKIVEKIICANATNVYLNCSRIF